MMTKRTVMTWVMGFIAGLVVAIVLGVATYRRAIERGVPGEDNQRPNPMQLRPKVKPKVLRFALAPAPVVS